MFSRPNLKGDYSAANWRTFNRFSLAFMLPYLMMIFACAWFIWDDGFFSYAGFVALEVIVLSTVLFVLMMLDAVAAISCKTVGKAKTNKSIKVATGADYEEDDDDAKRRRQSRKMKEADEFGDSYDAELHTSIKPLQDDETRKQI